MTALAALTLAGLLPMDICPKAPGNAEHYTNVILGYVLWGVGILFVVAIVVAVGAIVAGRVFSMPHASKLGVVSIVVVFIAAIAYLVLPGILKALMGSGCIG
jgi:hypothetical protein